MDKLQQLVSPQQLSAHIQNDDWRIVDCRFDLMAPDKGYEDYLAGHIPGAVYANLDTDLAAPIGPGSGRHPLPDIDDFASRLGTWGIDSGTRVVVYDNASGAIAARLWWMLNWLGHSATAVLDGGMAAWDRFGGEVETALPNAVPRRFDARVNEEMVISTDDVVRKLSGADDFILVDARDEQRFLGNVEPIDSVAGHVPGARNFPFSKSINADGTWKASENLAAAWRGLLTTAPGGEWAVMCGSGVTACHLALSASLARIPAPTMYVGSWSEWIRDTDRPVATGRGPGSAD